MFKSKSERGEHWISISDLMSGLMVIFLFVAISYMKEVTADRDKIMEIAIAYKETQSALYNALQKEFQDDLRRWRATLDRQTLSVKFHNPELLFESGKSALKAGFQEILQSFFPRYVRILQLEQFSKNIAEVRIEGHTSSEWSQTVTGDIAYFHNMELSQDRTRVVLEYCMRLSEMNNFREWAKKNITANGLSSSKPVNSANGEENKLLSRRVEFRVRTNADQKIAQILTVG
ncbi:MAG TPA: cell envelope biogenesis protein OmpA [Nitrospinae bacterium]|nr:cell envelope biogenesis protein OmpA [Nitrospinota bacterium]